MLRMLAGSLMPLLARDALLIERMGTHRSRKCKLARLESRDTRMFHEEAGNPRYEVDGDEVEKGKKKRNKKRERERGRGMNRFVRARLSPLSEKSTIAATNDRSLSDTRPYYSDIKRVYYRIIHDPGVQPRCVSLQVASAEGRGRAGY